MKRQAEPLLLEPASKRPARAAVATVPATWSKIPLLPEIWQHHIYPCLTDPKDSRQLWAVCKALQALWRRIEHADCTHIMYNMCQYYKAVVQGVFGASLDASLPVWQMASHVTIPDMRRIFRAHPKRIINRYCASVRAISLECDFFSYSEEEREGDLLQPSEWDVFSELIKWLVVYSTLTTVIWGIPLGPGQLLTSLPSLPSVKHLIVDTEACQESPLACPVTLFPNIVRLSILDKAIVPMIDPKILGQLTRLTLPLNHIIITLNTAILPVLTRLKLHGVRLGHSDVANDTSIGHCCRQLHTLLPRQAPRLARLTLVFPWQDESEDMSSSDLGFLDRLVWRDTTADITRIFQRGVIVESIDTYWEWLKQSARADKRVEQ